MQDKIARQLKISGRVQGVFYRESMRLEAERCGACGWVKNCLDGTVEAHVEGTPDAVETLSDWARRGPPSALVSEVESREVPCSHDDSFRVLPTI